MELLLKGHGTCKKVSRTLTDLSTCTPDDAGAATGSGCLVHVCLLRRAWSLYVCGCVCVCVCVCMCVQTCGLGIVTLSNPDLAYHEHIMRIMDGKVIMGR